MELMGIFLPTITDNSSSRSASNKLKEDYFLVEITGFKEGNEIGNTVHISKFST